VWRMEEEEYIGKVSEWFLMTQHDGFDMKMGCVCFGVFRVCMVWTNTMIYEQRFNRFDEVT